MNNNLKPFNLERALAGDPVITRDGRPVIELFHFKTAISTDQTLVVSAGTYPTHHSIDGKYYHDGPANENDLFMAPVEREYWCISALHIENNCIIFSGVYSSEGLEHQEYKTLYMAWKAMGTLKDFHEHKITRLG